MPESKVMTPEEFADRMRSLDKTDDTEADHVQMDDLMCELLVSLGYEEGVRVFKDRAKWYA